jgi:hypothetical protein
MYIPSGLIAATILAFVSPVHAQERYKVEFTIKDDTGGKPQPSLHYSMLVEESRKAVFQAGSRVADGCSSQLVDTGADIELTAHTSDGKVAIEGAIDLTSITGHVNLSSICEPIIGQRKIVFNTAVELGKPTLILDDPKALPLRQVEAVVTKVN